MGAGQTVPKQNVPTWHFGQNVTKPKCTQFITNTFVAYFAYFLHNKDKNTRDTRKEEKKYFI